MAAVGTMLDIAFTEAGKIAEALQADYQNI